MTSPTPVYEDNNACMKVINAERPTDRVRHIDTPYFRVQAWKKRGNIHMKFIPGILNPSDAASKPLCWVLHKRHCRRLLGHYHNQHVPSVPAAAA